MARTVYEIKRELQNLDEQYIKLNEETITRAMELDSEAVKKNQDEMEKIQTSRSVLRDELEKRQKEAEKNLRKVDTENPIESRGNIYRSILNGESSEDIKRGLFSTDIKTGNGGNNLIPTNLAEELIFENIKSNPIRDISTVTNIVGLEIPRVSYTIDDMDFVAEGETAKEVALKGEKVKFNNFTFRISTEISDSLLDGTNANLVNYVETTLREGLAKKEKYAIFKTTKENEKHMNIYSDTNNIKKVQGDTLFRAIKNALADLSDEYYNNATIVMRKNDYFEMMDELSNQNTNFYDRQANTILGVNVVFCEDADKPVIGDFKYLHINYYTDTKLESERNAREGRNYFILSGSFDIRLILTSAFRIAEIQVSGRTVTKDSKKDN